MFKKTPSKIIFGLFAVFFLSVIFFLFYNHYILDKSLANLKISLKAMSNSKTLQEAKKITGILQDIFIMDLTKGDFDMEVALEAEVGGIKVVDVSLADEASRKNQKFVLSMSSATKINNAENIVQTMSALGQLQDAKYFISNVIGKREESRPILLSKIDDLIVNFFPKPRKDNPAILNNLIESEKRLLASYSGQELQAKLLSIGRLYLRARDWDNSLTYFSKAITTLPESPGALTAKFYLGVLYKLRGNLESALSIFREIKKDLPKEWKMFSYYQEADSLAASGEQEKAISVLEEAFNEDPFSEIAQVSKYRVAYTYLYDLDNPEEARKVFSELRTTLKKQIDDEGAGAEILSHSSSIVSMLEKAKVDIAKKYREEGYMLMEKGYSTLDQIKYIEALERFNLALRDDNNDPFVYSGKAMVLYFLDRQQESLEHARIARDIAPKDAAVLATLGFIYYNIGMLQESIYEFKRAVSISPRSALFQYNLGTLYVLNGDINRATTHLQKALKINPEFAYPHNNLGYIFWLKGGYSEAKGWLEKAVAFKPDYIDGHYNLGILLFSLRKYDQSEREFLKVRELEPKYKKVDSYLEKIIQSREDQRALSNQLMN